MPENPFSIFIVEDDPWYGQVLKHHLSLNEEYKIELFEKASEIIKAMHKQPDLVCMDFNLPDMPGQQLLEELLALNNELPVLVISGQEQIKVAVELLKLGARDYIIKDENTNDLLWRSVINIRENSNLKKEVKQLQEQLQSKFDFEKTIIGKSDAIKNSFVLLQKAIHSSINVSLTGETGTGKEVYAKAIHFNSTRSKKPFVAVNMSAIPKELAESELFGHEAGAFTGATGTKIGKFEQANGGTLFLDEIGEMDLALQSKLLRALQEREITRLGGNKSIAINIRLITATHKNLAEEVQKNTFREDLYYRIIGLPISIPALRNRGNDVLVLAAHFISNYVKENNCLPLKISDKAKLKLLAHSYPGNVRELKSIIELACLMADNGMIEEHHITFHELGMNKNMLNNEKSLKEYNVEIIEHYLKKYNNNVVLVAEKLEIGKSKIYNLIKSGEISNN